MVPIPVASDVPKEDRKWIPSLLVELLAPGEQARGIARISLEEWRVKEGYAVVTDRRLIIVHDDSFIERGIIHRIVPLSALSEPKVTRKGSWDRRPEITVKTAGRSTVVQFHTRDLDYVRGFAASLAVTSQQPGPLTEIRTIEAGGEVLQVGVWTGLPTGPVVIYSNGLGGELSQWQPVTQLTPALTSITFDRPGFGRSPSSPRSSKRLGVECDRVVAVAEAIAPGRALVVVGWSYGGVIAEAVARLHPDRVKGLVLVDSHPTGKSHQRSVPFEDLGKSDAWKEENSRIPDQCAEARQLVRGTRIDAIPVRVLVAEEGRRMKRFRGNADAQSRRIDSGHEIMEDDPRAVAKAVRTVARHAI